MPFSLVQSNGKNIVAGFVSIFNNDNGVGVTSGDLLVAIVVSGTFARSVSDTTNGNWTEIDKVTFSGGTAEVSLWFRNHSAAIGINSLKVDVTTNGGSGAAICYNFGGNPDGSLNHVGLNQDVGTTALTASANCDDPNNLLVVAGASYRVGNATSTAATGDANNTQDQVSVVSGLTVNSAYTLRDNNTGSRSGGVTLSNAADWGAILVFFNLTAPAVAVSTRISDFQKRKVKPIRPRSVALVATVPPGVVATRAIAVQKRKVKPLRPRPVFVTIATAPPPTIATSIRTRLKRILRPLRMITRILISPPGLKAPVCSSLSDGLVTNPVLFDRLCP